MVDNNVILFEKKGPIGIITMNRPAKYNAMDGELYGKLHEAVKEFIGDESLLCAIITGAGDNFSAGGDLKWFQEMRGKYGEGWDYDYPAYKLLDKCKKPIIAAVDGYCIASGFNLAVLYCDFRIATERSKYGIPAVKRGLRLSYPIPFPWHMTLGNALYMVLTGKMLSAEEALRMGVISEIVPHEKLMERCIELATGICESAPMHIRCHKEFLRRFVEAPGFGQRLIDIIFEPLKSLKDSSEGRRAFIEKRKAKYENK
jgi:enoyl-CoA hydratase